MLRDCLCPFRRSIAFALCVVSLSLLDATRSSAEVKLPAVFNSNMVLQREMKNPVWGEAEPGEEVVVSIGDQSLSTLADNQGKWYVILDELKVGGPYSMTVTGDNVIKLENILVGEVWVCSGQSNMQWSVSQSNDADLEIKAANHPEIRLLSIPRVGTQDPQFSFEGEWEICDPTTVGDFSAVGYYFGRQLNQTLDVPIGLIDNAWGGSACEAWIPRGVLEADEQFAPLMAKWEQTEQTFDFEKSMEAYQTRLAKWKEAAAEARTAGKQPPRRPQAPRNVLAGQHRPANLYNGVLHPVIGYGMKGVIWYQGENNAPRAYQYRELFPLMIEQWRSAWEIGDFSFYWVQLADFRQEQAEPVGSDWAELREAQTMTLSRLPHTGQAVIIDLGEAEDIHPKNKQDVAKRLARHALAKDYGLEIVADSPIYDSMEVVGDKIHLSFKSVGSGLDTFDVRTPQGFAIAGEDQKFVWAEAKLIDKETIEVWSPNVSNPVAVRYAWADNPVCNVQSREGLPLTPFRTDQWPGVTANAK